ncbi:MAG: glycosyl hydrolase [Anaerolineae bacterium]
MRSNRWLRGLGGALILAGAALVLIALMAPASPTPEPLVPTRTPTPLTQTSEEALASSPSPASSTPWPPPPAIAPASTPDRSPVTPHALRFTYHGLPRWGIGVAIGPISRYNVKPLRLGWYQDWRARADPPRPGGIEYVQTVRLREGQLHPDAATLAAIAQANPGSLWLIGNEPDVKWQDNVEPESYARLYHEAYTAIKTADPTARVAIGGVSQPTPLRMRYLEAVLRTYREQFGMKMPIDVWNVHNFILREERGSWGVDIPPGFPDERGILYEIDDSGNLEAFRQQIWDFRRWMVAQGYGGWPLVVSEYGIPMPEDYGFPPERVIAFLGGTFDFFLTATDPSLGDPADGYRLVQRWAWYSLDAPDTYYPQGRLFDPQTGALTAVGEGWVNIVTQRMGGER